MNRRRDDRATNRKDGPGPAPGLSPEVVVAVGTDHHPFHRLVDWIDGWATRNPDRRVLVQRGTSRPTSACPSAEMLGHADLLEHFARATVVVCHGGPSTVMDARASGRFPVVVARDPGLGEHVDDHQLRFADHMRRHGLARVVDDPDVLWATLDEALTHPERFSVPVETTAISGVIEFAHMVDRLLGVTTPMTPAFPTLSAVPDRADDNGGRHPSVGAETTSHVESLAERTP